MKKEILLFGCLYGLLSIGLTYFMYQGSVGAFKSFGISILIMFVTLVIGILKIKKKGDGLISFSEILLFSVGVVVVGTMLSVIVTHLYLQTLSLEAKQTIVSNFVDSQLSSYEAMGMPMPEDFDVQLTEQMEHLMTLKGNLLNLPIILVIVGFMGMILGLIFKKDY